MAPYSLPSTADPLALFWYFVAFELCAGVLAITVDILTHSSSPCSYQIPILAAGTLLMDLNELAPGYLHSLSSIDAPSAALGYEAEIEAEGLAYSHGMELISMTLHDSF